MTLGAGALVWTGFDGERAPEPLRTAIRDGRIGGVVLFAYRGNVRTKTQVREMLAEIQAAAREGGLPPVPVAVDQEGGAVVRVGYRAVFPSAMALAATGDAALVERAARAVARGLRADGIAVNIAPVCDVLSEPRNTVIGTRAFGDDARSVAAFVTAWVRGSQAEGVAAVAKHFPGHGAVTLDPHHALVETPADRIALDTRDLVPFRAAFAAGAAGVMTAHVRYTAVDDTAPATLSRAILTGLLRDELGYDGLCLTDALEMTGAGVDTGERVMVRSLSAGADVLCATGPLDEALAAASALERDVPAERLRTAVARATAFRGRFGVGVGDDVDDAEARALAAEVAARAITHVGPALPRLRDSLRVAVLPPVAPSPVEELADTLGLLERTLRKRFGDVRVARDAAPDGSGPLVVFSFGAFFNEARAELLRRLAADAAVICALRTPFDVRLAPGVPALLSYSDVPASLEAVVAVLAGDRRATGRAPVRL